MTLTSHYNLYNFCITTITITITIQNRTYTNVFGRSCCHPIKSLFRWFWFDLHWFSLRLTATAVFVASWWRRKFLSGDTCIHINGIIFLIGIRTITVLNRVLYCRHNYFVSFYNISGISLATTRYNYHATRYFTTGRYFKTIFVHFDIFFWLILNTTTSWRYCKTWITRSSIHCYDGRFTSSRRYTKSIACTVAAATPTTSSTWWNRKRRLLRFPFSLSSISFTTAITSTSAIRSVWYVRSCSG